MIKNKFFALLTLGLLLISSVGTNVKQVSAGSSYPSPSADIGVRIVPVDGHDGAIVDYTTNADPCESVYIPHITLVNYAEAINNKKYFEAAEYTAENQIYTNLKTAYDLYCSRPVRSFNPKLLTNSLARKLSGNNNYDARNFCCAELFDLSLDLTALSLLNTDPKNKLFLKLYCSTWTEQLPVLLYSCSTKLDNTNWKLNTASYSVIENDGRRAFWFEFTELCPMFVLTTAANTNELLYHSEWAEEYPVNYAWHIILEHLVLFIVIICTIICVIFVIICLTRTEKKKKTTKKQNKPKQIVGTKNTWLLMREVTASEMVGKDNN